MCVREYEFNKVYKLRLLNSLATSSIHHRDHVSPDGHRFAQKDEYHPTSVTKTLSALVRHALGVVHGDKVTTIVVKMDGQVRRGGPGQTHVGGLGAPDGDPIELCLVVTAVFFPVHDDREHLGVDYELYRDPLIYIWGRSYMGRRVRLLHRMQERINILELSISTHTFSVWSEVSPHYQT
jgi:hypothetical protein